MAADAALELQAAINTAVSGSAALAALGIATVYDHVPDHVSADNFAPYCNFGPVFAQPDNTNGVLGQETMVQIDTWSRERGRVRVLQIMAALRTLLERSSLAVTGQQYVACWLESAQAMTDPDGVTAHGVQTFRFLTHE